MTHPTFMKAFTWILTLTVAAVIFFLLRDCKGLMAPAPAGIHGHFSSVLYCPAYQASFRKDSLLKTMQTNGLSIRSGRLHDYDPPWDSLRYIIGNIPCDTAHVEAYIEFLPKGASGSTFRVIWFNASPITDDNDYDRLTARYYDCFEKILTHLHVRKISHRFD